MAITEKQRHQLFTRAEQVLGPEEAETMMELIGPATWGDLATKADLAELRVATKADLAELRLATRTDLEQMRHDMTKTFVSWMLTSQAAFTAIIAAFFSVAR